MLEACLKSSTQIYDQALIDGYDIYEAVRLYLDQKDAYNDYVVSTARCAAMYRNASQPSSLSKLSRLDHETFTRFK